MRAASSFLIMVILAAARLLSAAPPQGQPPVRSHPPLRVVPTPPKRPPGDGPAFYVSASQGDNGQEGSREKPWMTIAHALTQLGPGDTLYLRGGTYYERVYVALQGRPDAPITLRSFPGEEVIVDGGLREFYEDPQNAWQPYAEGAPGEYRSAHRYPNLRQVLGCFGDSMIGLNTYYYAMDLRAENEEWVWKDPQRRQETDAEPIYCGPGLWYDAATGYIHARLAHTHLPGPVNYQGPTDPRELPLVLASFAAVTLALDGARHVHVEDLVLRGGGYNTVTITGSGDVEFDHVAIWCGTYGMRIFGTEELKLLGCSLFGTCPPWLFRGDTSKRAYPGRPHRDITRLNTHANLVIDAGREFDVYAHPNNDHWEIAYCQFTDAHDGPYLGGVNLRFHHNVIDGMQDDGVYLSQMYPRHLYMGGGAEIHLYQNYFGRALTALAFGGPEDTRDTIYIYRNVFDLRGRVPTGRPSGYTTGKVIGDHGGPPWPTMRIYHNTFVLGSDGYARDAALGTLGHSHPDRPRHVFNNIFLRLGKLLGHKPADAAVGSLADGNLYWSPGADPSAAAAFFDRFRKSPAFSQSKEAYPPGFDSHSLVADPKLVRVSADPMAEGDYRLQPGSPAIDAGAALPDEWPDPLRAADKGPPDVGAYPAGIAPWPLGPAGLDASRGDRGKD